MRTLFLLRGAPASGKSSWIEENNLKPYTLCADEIRLLYQSPLTSTTGEKYISQNNDTEVWKLLMQLLEGRMKKGEFVVVDATHYKSSLISRYKDLVTKYRYRVYVVNFAEVPEEECLRRNANRTPYKRVPEEVIQKMYACLHDDTEVKKAYKLLTPNEAVDMLQEGVQPVQCNSEKVVIFGDIHGCYEPLKEYFDKNPFNKDYCYIFCGDYLDRGLQNREVLEFLLSIYKEPNVFLIEGNHEIWLREYSAKDYEEVKKEKASYYDFYLDRITEQLNYKKVCLEKAIRRNTNTMEELSKLLKESWLENPLNKEVYYEFEKVNVPQKQQELSEQNDDLRREIDHLGFFVTILKYEKDNSLRALERAVTYYNEEFGEGLSFSVDGIIKKRLGLERPKFENPIRSAEFLNNTIPQIKDVDKSQIRQLCQKFIQMSYFEYGNKTFFVSHGGLPCLPDLYIPTEEMIKGVGKYEEHREVDTNFEKNTPNFLVQVHGHRNVLRETLTSEGRTFNLEGQVEFGGCLRVLELTTDHLNRVQYNPIEIKNNIFKEEEKDIVQEKSDIEVLKEMLHSKLIDVKNLGGNIISLNFSRDAFHNSNWNSLTCTARGLFVDKATGDIVARSFSKFFNHNEVDETTTSGLKQNFKFPVIGYKKENGFLGIITKYKGEVKFFTKSSDKGDYVNWFIGVLCDHYGIVLEDAYGDGSNRDMSYSEHYNQLNEYSGFDDTILRLLRRQLVDKLSPYITEGYSYVFECVDKDNDPHIIKYERSNVYLLEVFKNQLKEEHIPYDDLIGVASALGVPLKQSELYFTKWEQFEEWKETFTKGVSQWDCRHEGYVFEGANGFRVKFKSSFYKFWKQMRGIKDGIQSGRGNKKIYKTKEEIQVVKLLESIPKDTLKSLSIIDIEKMFYEKYEG